MPKRSRNPTEPRKGQPSVQLGRQEFERPYATSHAALDSDRAVQREVRDAARALVEAVRSYRLGKLPADDKSDDGPRPK